MRIGESELGEERGKRRENLRPKTKKCSLVGVGRERGELRQYCRDPGEREGFWRIETGYGSFWGPQLWVTVAKLGSGLR